MWVANCFASGPSANVVRVDAKTLGFERTLPLRAAQGYEGRRVTRLDSRTPERRSIKLGRHADALAWSEGYGDLWMTNFDDQSVSRLHAETGERKTPRGRIGATASFPLRVTTHPAGVTSVAAGAGAIWATVPDDHAVWRIVPQDQASEANQARVLTRGVSPWATTGSGWRCARTMPDASG